MNIEIENKKMVEWIEAKDVLLNEGLAVLKQLEKVESEITSFQNKEKMITGKISPDATLKEEGDRLANEHAIIEKRLDEIIQSIEKKKMDAIPEKLLADHKEALKKRENLKRDMKKIENKIQKIKDRLVPLMKKEIKPLLQEFDDVDTPTIVKGKVVFPVYNHLENFKRQYRSKTK